MNETAPTTEDTGAKSDKKGFSARVVEWFWGHPDRLWIIAISLVSYITLRLTSPAVGFTRDEGYYFKAGEQYFGWYRALWNNLFSGKFFDTFSDATIVRFFEYNNEHPVLLKTMMGFSWWLSHEVLGITENAEGFRIVGPLFAAICAATTFALGRRYGLERPYALFAGLAWLLMPHNYFHSHLACFDVPVTAMTVLVVYTFLRGRSSLKGAVIAGVIFGLACAAKHNALFLFFLLLGFWGLTRLREFRLTSDNGFSLRLPPIPLAFVLMAVCMPLIMYLHWPYLWHHPFERFGSYLAFHANHEHYPISLGRDLLLRPPFPIHFPFTMTALTMPLATLALSIAGMVMGLRAIWRQWRGTPLSERLTEDGDKPAWVLLLWGIMAIFPIALIALPSVPIFGGVKHWMPATPFLALFAALALRQCARALTQVLPRVGHYAPAVVLVVALLPSVIGTVATHPYGMSYYNELAGGVRGGAQLNLQRTFWGHSGRELIVKTLKNAPKGSRVFFNRTNFDSYRMYKRDGLITKGLQYASKVEHSDMALIYHQGGYYEEMYKVWKHYGNRTPIAGVYLNGVPLVTLHAKAKLALSAD